MSLLGLLLVAPSTWCNPLPLPDYPVGRFARSVTNGDPLDQSPLWLLGHKEQYRELADPTMMVHEGGWYLYPSCDMAWVSKDHGATWQHTPISIEGQKEGYRDLGYAPTVERHGNQFLLVASDSALYVADSPLGPFKPLGKIALPSRPDIPPPVDPALFSDQDGRLYYYWGCTATNGIWGVELDAKAPTKLIGQPRKLLAPDTTKFPWEALGEWNQNRAVTWMEGAWMFRHGDTYYLTYSAAGTENKTYAIGCYTGRSPLGPFTPQQKNPIVRQTDGLITGTGHGSFYQDPDGQIWCVYTVRASVAHGFERRIGMDRAEIDSQGELWVPEVTSFPQWVSGHPPQGAPFATGWVPLNDSLHVEVSSSAPNLPGRFAVDDSLRTWWQPDGQDATPTLTLSLIAKSTLHAVRVIWRDIGLNTNKGVNPGPFRYHVDVETAPGQWTTVVDQTHNETDLLIDYRECPPVSGDKIRLVVTGWPKGITPGIVQFTPFGVAGK
ncbi:MAG: family 43 glycosylhydrolase [Chthoniobacteraceae bacterium]